ncbi:MAG TPA: hypothetical protein VG265_03650 [Gaiellaceae bacterium]|nr:hypothetical protein [Gaiellaceae bacterium]
MSVPLSLERHELRHSDGRRLLVYGPLRGRLPDRKADAEVETVGVHRRLDVFTGSWVVISPARNVRPAESGPAPDGARCPFCPGGFEVPFPYDAAVFDNRFPPLRPDPPPPPSLEGPTGPARGRAEIVLYTERHDASFGDLSPTELGRVLAVWTDRSRELWADPAHAYVSIFENRGAAVGATISHPHGQIYAVDHIPPVIAAKAEAHHRARGRGECLSCAAVGTDELSPRLIAANAGFVVSVPFAPRWPYQLAVRARRHGAGRLGDLEPSEQIDLIVALDEAVRRLDALLGFPAPYMMVAQEAPRDQPDWHLCFELYPLNRSSQQVKIRASSETGLGLFLDDVEPEAAARRLAGLEIERPPVEPGHLMVVDHGEPPA